jgi:hypothetical protein
VRVPQRAGYQGTAFTRAANPSHVLLVLHYAGAACLAAARAECERKIIFEEFYRTSGSVSDQLIKYPRPTDDRTVVRIAATWNYFFSSWVSLMDGTWGETKCVEPTVNSRLQKEADYC